MNSQLRLFPSAPCQRHSETSRLAAKSIEPSAATMRRLVLDYLRNGPATDEEQQIGLGMNPSTQRPRRIELVNAGFVKDSGLKRDTTSGRKAVVWEAIP